MGWGVVARGGSVAEIARASGPEGTGLWGRGDAVRRVGRGPTIASMTLDAVDSLNATLVDRQDLTATLAIVRIAPLSGQAVEFEPGQFVSIGLPRGREDTSAVAAVMRSRAGSQGPRLIRRAYSIASSPQQRRYLEFLLVRVDDGKLTPRLFDVPVGGRVYMDATAKGEFTLANVPHTADLVFIATGTGLAPFMSMIRAYRGTGRWRRLVLIHGVRFPQDLAYREELQRATLDDSTIRYIPLCSRVVDGDNWTGQCGRVQTVLSPDVYESLTGQALNPEHAHVFLCGNPEMIKDVSAMLEPRGFRRDVESHEQRNLHYERYW